MINRLKKNISALKYEMSYRVKLLQHLPNLPALEERDRIIVESLQRDGIYITTLADLGLTSTTQMLNAAHSLLPEMGKTNYSDSSHNPPEIYIVTDLPDIFNWGGEQRLHNIIENYIGLPIAYHGVHLRKDFVNQGQFDTLLWHRDIEDRRVLKIIVYLSDVEEKHGPFEYVPLSLTSMYRLNFYRIQAKIKNSGINNETLNKIVPKSAWKSCTGAAGTVIFADTRRLLHHGTLRTEERSTLFFVYTANPPKQPQLCTHYWDNSFPRPKLAQASGETKVGTSPTLTK
ncbi:MAG: phytanoyl-CoA dioxygenase [Aulosira sp. ZfuVER01]|nr:phytanoyl-CoA dioxygenase [Aulosira sp. ZfuVER01]MDZ7999776.1 phytanoyl-CoA dioxygenase [Aulosira sp. DedVER01a]MDZ8049856.1 phytanoyl-CoA dioxygenase [Aulosira sp. ZfuCHP01]